MWHPLSVASNRLATGNPTTRVVVGLGNAERQYQYTRHNVGARAVTEAVSRLGLRPAPGLDPGADESLGFVLPAGYMNDSGLIVLKAVERWRPTAEGLLIVHDDLDLALGEVRERDGGGHGGHNGLRDVIARLGTGAFRRLRIGIGRPPGSMTRPTTSWLPSARPSASQSSRDRPGRRLHRPLRRRAGAGVEWIVARARRPAPRRDAARAEPGRGRVAVGDGWRVTLAADLVPDRTPRVSLMKNVPTTKVMSATAIG